jgi:hypothetical protein
VSSWVWFDQVQAHGADAMVDEEHCVFFLSHRPRGEIQHYPVFLFMKGTGKSVLPLDICIYLYK